MKTLKWGKKGACMFFVNRMRGGTVKVVPFGVRVKTLKGQKSQESCVLYLV